MGGSGSFQTSYKVWREGHANVSCTNAVSERELGVTEIVRFDEAENGVGVVPRTLFPPFGPDLFLPPASRTSVADAEVFPQLTNGAVAGWMYLNLDKCSAGVDCDDAFANQNWVVTSMRAQGRYSGDMDATSLGNGCSPKAPTSEITTGTAQIGPAGNVNP
jgi:hypothetical protein